MTSKDRGQYSKKHPADLKIRPEVADAVMEKTREGKITCAAAFKVSKETGVTPAEVGFTIDSLEIKISKCQMGIFGYGKENKIIKTMDAVPENLERALKDSAADSRLSCEAAWAIAEDLEVSRMEVASACETLKVKVFSCQLGAF